MKTNTDEDRITQLLAFVSEIERKSGMTLEANEVGWDHNWCSVEGRLTTQTGFAPISITMTWRGGRWQLSGNGIYCLAVNRLGETEDGGEV